MKISRRSDRIEFFVSPNGNDTWSGTLSHPTCRGTNGPFATIATAQRAVREHKKRWGFHNPVRIVLRGGTYFLKSPLVLKPADSGKPRKGPLTRSVDDPACSVIYAAYPGEMPILSGGRPITGWREGTINGKDVWVASIPEVKRGRWNFRQIWVNGQRRHRVRLPRHGLYRIAELFKKPTLQDTPYNAGQDRFMYAPGDLSAEWRNLNDVEIVFPNFWIDSHMQIHHIVSRKRLVVLDRRTATRLIDESWRDGVDLESCLGFYRVENVFEALSEPGEWYLDRPAGQIYYIPMPGEDITTAEIIAPHLEQVLRIKGRLPDKEQVEEICFEGITFSHTERALPQGHAAPGVQSACDVPGAVTISNARDIRFDGCMFTHLGGYALECSKATRDVTINRSDIRDLGAGGIKVWHGCNRTTISDCHIHDGGHVYHSGVGVLIGKASGNLVLHNEIHDFDYSGISVGWDWSYNECDGYGNVIEYNHIYNIGRGKLSDMGGIYMLGVASGTRIRFNVIHDIWSRAEKAWGIYLDACSAYILVERNLVFRAKEGCLMMNQNRGHVIRNNVFAFGGQYQLNRHVLTVHDSCTFERNIVYGPAAIIWSGDWRENRANLNHNLYFNPDRKTMDFGGMTFRKWQKRGLDAGSLITDPKFKAPEKGDFRLDRNSPVFKLGFEAFDLSAVGLRIDNC